MRALVNVATLERVLRLATDLDFDLLSATFSRKRRCVGDGGTRQGLGIQIIELLEHGWVVVEVIVARGATLMIHLIEEEVVPLHRFLQLLLVEHIRVALDTVRASFIHQLLGKVQLALVQLDYVLVAYQILVLQLILWLLAPGVVSLFKGAIYVFLLRVPLQLVVTGDPGERGGHVTRVLMLLRGLGW